MINHKLLNSNVEVFEIPIEGYLNSINGRPQTHLLVHIDNEWYFKSVFKININNQLLYFVFHSEKSEDRKRQFRASFNNDEHSTTTGVPMSRSNILKQGTKEMRMYEYFVIYTLGNQYSAINFNVYCEDIIKIETIQKMENNSFFTTFIDYISGYFDL